MFAKDTKAGRRVEKPYSGGKKVSVRYSLTGCCSDGDARGRQARSSAVYVVGLRRTIGFSSLS